MDEIQQLLKQADSNSKIAGLVLAIKYLKSHDQCNEDIETSLESIYQSMGRKFLFKLLSSTLFTDDNTLNATSLTCYQVAISVTMAMAHNPHINRQIIAGILPLFSNILAQITATSRQPQSSTLVSVLQRLCLSIVDCSLTLLQCYHHHNCSSNNADGSMPTLLRYYVAVKSNHYNQKNAKDANVYSMATTFLKYMAWLQSRNDDDAEEEEEKKQNSDKNGVHIDLKQQQQSKVLKIIEYLILSCYKLNDVQNESLMIAQKIFMRMLVQNYHDCRTELKFEFPAVILSVFYHVFGDGKQTTNNACLTQCLLQIQEICVDSLASRMYDRHRIQVFKLVQMCVTLRKHQWFLQLESSKKTMDGEKRFLFIMGCVCNELRISLESKPLWNAHAHDAQQLDAIDTILSIFEKLVSFVISEDEAIDAWISSFTADTMHQLQQHIHSAVRALFFYVTELKYAVFEKQNDQQKTNNNTTEEVNAVEAQMQKINDGFKKLSMDEILDENTLKMLNRILYGITFYINYDSVTFKDEFLAILPFVMDHHRFEDRYVVIIANVVSQLLTTTTNAVNSTDSSASKEDDASYRQAIVDSFYTHRYLFDVVIEKTLHRLMTQYEALSSFELENQLLSIGLLIHDIFSTDEKRFMSMLFDDECKCKLQLLFTIIARVANVQHAHHIVLPLIVVMLQVLNKTADETLHKFIQPTRLTQHIHTLIGIANKCQKESHAWNDEIAMNLDMLTSSLQ